MVKDHPLDPLRGKIVCQRLSVGKIGIANAHLIGKHFTLLAFARASLVFGYCVCFAVFASV